MSTEGRMTLTRVAPQVVKSDTGVVVKFVKRDELQYIEGDHVLPVEVESYVHNDGSV